MPRKRKSFRSTKRPDLPDSVDIPGTKRMDRYQKDQLEQLKAIKDRTKLPRDFKLPRKPGV